MQGSLFQSRCSYFYMKPEGNSFAEEKKNLGYGGREAGEHLSPAVSIQELWAGETLEIRW